MMAARIEYAKTAPEAVTIFRSLEVYLRRSDLDPKLRELVKTRVSQINGCGFCVDMHTKEARALGETEQRLYLLSAWREAPCYSGRERAALAWTEALTLVAGAPISDDLYAETRRHFDKKELVDLTFAVIAINGWNRLAIPFRTPVGSYEPRRAKMNE